MLSKVLECFRTNRKFKNIQYDKIFFKIKIQF